MGRWEDSPTKRDGMNSEFPRPGGTIKQKCIAGTGKNCKKTFKAEVTIFPGGGRNWNRICPKCKEANQQIDYSITRKAIKKEKPKKEWWSDLVGG